MDELIETIRENAEHAGDISGFQHTPGPWFAEPRVARGTWVHNRHGEFVAMVCGLDREDVTEEVANADLVVAGPDMLAALRLALSDLEGTYSHVSSVSADRIKSVTIPLCRAAIAKATGEVR